MKNVDLYVYGFDVRLLDTIKNLENALGKSVSKHTKDICISEAIGTMETLRLLIDIKDPENKEDDTNVQ